MNKTMELEQAERDVKDTELKLHRIKTTLKDVQAEIASLDQVEKQLEENINFLKQSGATVLAQEFKKAREDLIRTRGRLSMIRIDRDNIEKAEADCEAYLIKSKAALVKALLGKDNVLTFKRKPNGSG